MSAIEEIRPNGRHQRNGHTLELREAMWLCLQCGHVFDAATDAELFFCGDPCVHAPGTTTSDQQSHYTT